MRKRKTVSYLNQLRRDVRDSLEAVTIAATEVDSAAYDLSCIDPHDIVTNDAEVKELYDVTLDCVKELNAQLKTFKAARDLYMEFF